MKTSIHYADAANQIETQKDFVFKNGSAAQQFKVRLGDKTKRSYEYSVQYFLADGSKKATQMQTSMEPTLILEAPAA